MADPTLAGRLGSLELPALVLWGRSDGIVDVDYGRAYAAAIPLARFQLLPDTGHSPQLETPDQVIRAIWDSADTDFSATGRPCNGVADPRVSRLSEPAR
jgi:pimeloyl-ACP methyl ester carboxylesterase